MKGHYYTVLIDRADGSKFMKDELVQQIDGYDYFESVTRPLEQWHLNSNSITIVMNPGIKKKEVKSRLELIED